MAADLAPTPVSGITVQLCGDAHLSNFGVFGTPERQLIFDINDFDETPIGQSPVRRAAQLGPPDAPPPAADRGLASELARPALDHSAVLVAGLGRRSDPGRRQ